MSALRRWAMILCAAAASALSSASAEDAGAPAPTLFGYEVKRAYPHATDAYTQGLFIDDGKLIETTGHYGRSRLQRIDLETGAVELSRALPKRIFGEGATRFGDEIFVLSWREGEARVYDAQDFQLRRAHRYAGEGWGLTDDGERLIMSDGTHVLRFIDPESFDVVKRLDVTLNGRALRLLNELEWVKGDIFANVYQSDFIVRIDPNSGVVTGVIDLRGLLPASDVTPGETDVLNGIAYDSQTDRLFVTGKNWPKLFELALIARSTDP